MSNHNVKYELVVDWQYHAGLEGLPTNLASNWLPPVPGTVIETKKDSKISWNLQKKSIEKS